MKWAEEPEPVHLWFGLSYANYLVVPRSVLQSMPQEWQARFVTCLEEMGAAFEHLLDRPAYHVLTLAREPERLLTEQCPECEGEGETAEGEQCDVCDGDGELDADGRYETPEEVGIVTDPIPAYNRGRTRLDRRDP